MSSAGKWSGSIVEYLDRGKFEAGLVIREQDRHVGIIDSAGQERLISRDLVMLHHPQLHPSRADAPKAISALRAERASLEKELDLNLLWEVAQEQGRSFSAAELAELFFGLRSMTATSVMLEALMNDRLFFMRRHMEFVPRPPEQVERLRVQQDRIRSRSEGARHTQAMIRDILSGATPPASPETEALAEELAKYLRNPFTRSRELTQILSAAAPDVDPAEASFEVLDRIGAKPDAPRFAFIAGLRSQFSEAALAEAASVAPGPRAALDTGFAVTIDDEDTVEIDDALSCHPLPGGGLRVQVHIALVADFVAKGGAMDEEAAARATTVYLPETTIPMLPDAVSSDRASLIQRKDRPVITTDLDISATGEVQKVSIYPAQISVTRRLDYAEADRLMQSGASDPDAASQLRMLEEIANRLRERRRMAGAMLVHRREPKVTVRGRDIQIRVLDSDSRARAMVAEFMVLSNFVAARFSAENRIPIIYRVQPEMRGEAQRPRLSLYPEYHAGVGLDYYAQFSSPIRRYADLVLQRQLVASISGGYVQPYNVDELLRVLAGAENAEANGRELERRAKRYWILRYLEKQATGSALRALTFREGATAELADFAVRGTLRGAPNLPDQTRIEVQVNRVDPLRGWLVLEYVRTIEKDAREGF
ncbi:MAG TPA: ribonuclease catalytic domain-containing protein [Candidatus Binataceae bacterium]|nr:ribonuclease catalytic domain-containing protein [Candidatus Binataceae bacterium]